jgi:hypothetical protein
VSHFTHNSASAKFYTNPQETDNSVDRDYRRLLASSARAGQGAAAVVIGSNANRLTAAFTDLGKKVETINGGGWIVTKESVDTLLLILKAKNGAPGSGHSNHSVIKHTV